MRDVNRESPMLTVRAAQENDAPAIWRILEPIARAGATFALPYDLSPEDGLSYWFAPGHRVFVAEERGAQQQLTIVGSYFLRPNQRGGGAHVANAAYMTEESATGRGIARAMCVHSLDEARHLRFRAMQFNFVVSTNERAIRLWTSLGFRVVGRLPGAFLHPSFGYVDALVMFQEL